LIALRPDEPAEEIGPHDGLPGGGPLLVDREQSLWLGTFSGLIQYPEPETTIWNQKDGLPSAHLRALAQTHEGIWLFAWQGVGRIKREQNAWRVFDEKMLLSRPCTDNLDMLIVDRYPDGLLERRGERFIDVPNLPTGAGLYGCTRAHDGSLFFATTSGVLRRQKEQTTFEETSSPLLGMSRAAVFGIFEDSQQRVWASTQDGRICNASGKELIEGQNVSWSCQEIDQSPDMFDFKQLPSSTIWASSSRAGMWRYRGDRWERIPGSKKLQSQVLYSLATARNGGVWLVGQGVTMRVVERLDLADGWEIVEVISAWEGLPGSETTQLIEEDDGDIWLSTPSGVVLVPSGARQSEFVPPLVRTIEVVINGQTIETGQHALSLSHNSNVELRFSALSYRDRSRLRYQYRLRPNEQWIDSRDTAPVLRFVGLRPGNYQIEVRASLDGTNWTATPAQLQFEVLNPWYLRPITLILFVILLAAVLYLIYRARIGMLTRLEKQRARIAMDLHDQMGSGLGSIGILSGLAAEDNLSGVSRKDLAEKIAATAGELGNSLSEIVWALKPEAATLDALAYHVAERGGRMFPSDVPAFITEFPAQWPKVELSLAVRRNLLLIASEALHNAARHSGAKLVKFGISQERGKRWRLWVADDGRGFSNGASSSSGSGIGLNSMCRRADEITANISWTTNNGKGTIVTVVFDPRAEDLRIE
jgi:ligand-binding sensor domain-containing protein/anti-sigma regulatory factor (Ser/Thr protein kinase)